MPLLSDVLEHYDERRTREPALYTSWLAEAHIMLGAIDEAVADFEAQVRELADSA